MTLKYFNVKNGLTTGNIILNASNSNISASAFIGNINVTNSANLGAVGNVTITGGTAGYVLSTNGSGGLSWVAQSAGGGSSISNGSSNVNIATANGNITMSVNGIPNIAVVSSSNFLIDTSANITGNLVVGNISTTAISGTLTTGSQPNITTVGTLGNLS